MNNKYWKKTLSLPLFMALLAGCSQQNEYPGVPGGVAGQRPLGVASLLAPVPASQTRSTTISPLPADGEVGFFVQGDAGYAAVSNKKGIYKADESMWLPTDSIWLGKVAAKLAVYYPYDAAQTTAGKLNLKAAVRTDDTKDLWSTRFEADSHTKNIKLTLTQLYSRLSVTFVKMESPDYTGTSALTQIKLAGTGIYAGATYNPLDGTYAYGTAGYAAALTGITVKGTNAAADDATKVDLLLPPYETLTGDITLTATVDTKEMKVTIPKAKLANTLAAGRQYNITVKLKPTALVLASVKTTDWDSQAAFSGEAEMENPPVPHAIEVEGLDFYVADGNLRAIKQADGTYEYAFAEEQGYYSGVNDAAYDPAGGDYFCWNTLDPNLTDENQTEWKDERDPCRQIDGGQWYTPTEAQLQALIDAGNIWGESIYKMKDGTKVNGRYFGTSTVPSEADQDKYVFLPAAGYRDGSSYNGTGTYGYYWSGTLYTSDTNIAYDLYFRSGTCYVGGLDRNYGFSLRCVRNK